MQFLFYSLLLVLRTFFLRQLKRKKSETPGESSSSPRFWISSHPEPTRVLRAVDVAGRRQRPLITYGRPANAHVRR
jgi:hypothetical protein